MTRELSALADVLDPLWGTDHSYRRQLALRADPLAVNSHYGPILPRTVLVNGHAVKVGWFTSEQDPHKALPRRTRPPPAGPAD
ncbi:hypothetical protein [Streptomyces capitiformicae]|uniref:hypothetical protein n=1 Tax=Streptomyces capitiformicae TaxID=2014920 RepID=UPI0027E45C8E|nr:hypothetical protein [Streptomyces capitiformicae]